MRTLLSIAVFYKSEDLAARLDQSLQNTYAQVKSFDDFAIFLDYVKQNAETVDCVIVEDCELLDGLHSLRSSSILLPFLIIQSPPVSPVPGHDFDPSTAVAPEEDPSAPFLDEAPSCPVQHTYRYHEAELAIAPHQLHDLQQWISESINRFITLSLEAHVLPRKSPVEADLDPESASFGLSNQQQLAEKLRERLGYLGVYYKRNPENFLRYLPRGRQKELLERLKLEYRHLILSYFGADNSLNQQIDHFVHATFFADVPVSKVVEIHIGLMDEFAKQLKLEGRSEEVLLDYRLTLIDVLAHLCEMYRRSIPRES